MKISELLEQKQADWKALERLLVLIQTRGLRKMSPEELYEFDRRYRAVCSDLMLARSLRFPAATIQYLHQLTAESHNTLYRSERFQLRDWGKSLFIDAPGRIARDPCIWIAHGLFWGLFLGATIAAATAPEFARAVVGDAMLAQIDEMYSKPIGERGVDEGRAAMAGFYVFNNASIGLKCFASGIFFGIGSLFTLGFNALLLGAIFGHMASGPHADHFFTFVTAHGPFELTAVAISGGAGLRLGWSVIDTDGWSRQESLWRTAPLALSMAGVATLLFIFAAFIEAFVSPADWPYVLKAAVAGASALVLLFYFGLGFANRSERRTDETR